MNQLFVRSLVGGLLLCTAVGRPAAAQARQEMLLTTDWKFTKGDVPNAAQPTFNDAKWQTVSVPHDWAIYGPFDGNNDLQKVAIEQNNEKAATLKAGRTGGLPFIGTGWYRRALASGTGRVQSGGVSRDVVFTHVPDPSPSVDDAYLAKYARYGATANMMVTDEARTLTIRVEPA